MWKFGSGSWATALMAVVITARPKIVDFRNFIIFRGVKGALGTLRLFDLVGERNRACSACAIYWQIDTFYPHSMLHFDLVGRMRSMLYYVVWLGGAHAEHALLRCLTSWGKIKEKIWIEFYKMCLFFIFSYSNALIQRILIFLPSDIYIPEWVISEMDDATFMPWRL